MSGTMAEIGKHIRDFRKMRHMTLEDMSKIICKSKATISKYERGEIAVDVETLYELAAALNVHVEQLLYCPPDRVPISASPSHPAFFNGVSHFFSYLFDGRSNQIIRCRFDVLSKTEQNQYKLMMYMNFSDYGKYQICENTYWGYIEHFDAITNIVLTNRDTPMEKASVQILASYLDADTKWGLWNGFSSRPMMPIATKMLFSREILKEDPDLSRRLKISKEDIRLLKLYNMLAVT
ncbi:MAG: helix-turn-helix transcriptional regulator [Enterocloster asparagiformis]|nr:helix-turn-helix transcriptional regulator [Enterocloster asparagiformis]